MSFEIDEDDLGAESGVYKGTVEENVQYGPPAPLTVGLPSWIGIQTNVMYIGAGLIGAYLLYRYWGEIQGS